MKKIVSVLLALLMITAAAPLNAFAEETKEITYIEINLDPKIAGKTPADYREFLTVSGEGVVLGSEDYFRTTYLENVNGFGYTREAEVFEEGVRYTSVFNVYPKEGYTLIMDTGVVPIQYNIHRSNGTVEGSASYLSCEGIFCDNIDYAMAEHYHITINFTAEAQEPEGFAKISHAISQFFLAIATFFTETFIQPIVDLIEKIA